MKKACCYCGKIHLRSEVCPKKPAQKPRDHAADLFRSSRRWKLKREEIKRRDGYRCRACLAELPGTLRRVNPYRLSVHHIHPLSERYDLRLDDDNLITLCAAHHEAAESGDIPAEILLNLIKNTPPEGV